MPVLAFLSSAFPGLPWRSLARLALGLLCALPPVTSSRADPLLQPEESARVVSIVDGDTLVLDDGREVRLVGIQAPKLPLGRPDFIAWPLAQEAKEALAGLTLERTVRLAYGGRKGDRHGRTLAHLTLDDGAWVQGRMLELGFARVYSFDDNRALIPEMLALEEDAREAGRGIWGDPFYALRRVVGAGEDLARDIGKFVLVEGQVQQVAVVRGRAFLNFGEDWRSDFTVSLAPAVRKLFVKEGHDPERYQGRWIRVRGWLESYNGPEIQATHPEQIQLLDRPSSPD